MLCSKDFQLSQQSQMQMTTYSKMSQTCRAVMEVKNVHLKKVQNTLIFRLLYFH